MKNNSYLLLGLGLTLLAAPSQAVPAKHIPAHQTNKARQAWVTAYYPVWRQQEKTFLPNKIDFSGFSHLIHFAVTPNADGTINNSAVKPNSVITPAESAGVIGPAHAAGRKVLLCVGGSETAPLFRTALSDAVRPRFIASLVSMAVTRGYDGLDIDMEPIRDADAPQYEAFIRELRAKMTAARPGLLLTAATAWEPALFARLQGQFDQINLMTYDLSGPWAGFNTWYNASLHDSGGQLMPGGVPYTSADGTLRPFIQAGIAPRKMGVGIAFYGDVWVGTDGPKQSIKGVTNSQVAYSIIMDQYYQPNLYHWDDQAHAPYLSIAAPDPKDRKFISYDDERLCAEKVTYARRRGLGGVIIWELGDGYRPNQPPGRRNPLLQAVKTAWLEGGTKQSAR